MPRPKAAGPIGPAFSSRSFAASVSILRCSSRPSKTSTRTRPFFAEGEEPVAVGAAPIELAILPTAFDQSFELLGGNADLRQDRSAMTGEPLQEVIDRRSGLAREVDLLLEAKPVTLRRREEAVQPVERVRPVHGPEGELVEHDQRRAERRQRGDLAKENGAVHVLRRLLEQDNVEWPRALEGLQADRMEGKLAGEARLRYGNLGRIGSDPLGVITQAPEPREGRAETHSHLQEPARRRRKPRQQQIRRPLLSHRYRLVFSLAQAVVEIGDIPLFRKQDVREDIEGKKKGSVEALESAGPFTSGSSTSSPLPSLLPGMASIPSRSGRSLCAARPRRRPWRRRSHAPSNTRSIRRVPATTRGATTNRHRDRAARDRPARPARVLPPREDQARAPLPRSPSAAPRTRSRSREGSGSAAGRPPAASRERGRGDRYTPPRPIRERHGRP